MKTFLLLALALLTPASAQDWDYCDPPAITLPAIAPCPHETHRDVDAVVLCVSAFWQTVADARVAACTAGRAAVALWTAQRTAAMQWYMDKITELETDYFECLRNGGDPNGCNAIYQVAKAKALVDYTQMLADADALKAKTLATVELTFYQAAAAAQTDFSTCIDETAPCE